MFRLLQTGRNLASDSLITPFILVSHPTVQLTKLPKNYETKAGSDRFIKSNPSFTQE